MKGRHLMNMRVQAPDGHLYGLVKDARVHDGHIEYLVLDKGGVISHAAYVCPVDVKVSGLDALTVERSDRIVRTSRRHLLDLTKDSFSLFGVRVYDMDSVLIGKVADSTIANDFAVTEFEVSRSFFDDLDRGFALIDTEALTLDNGSLHYNRHYYDIPERSHSGGIIRKVLGGYRENING